MKILSEDTRYGYRVVISDTEEVEYVVFERDGRPHTHEVDEFFLCLSGEVIVQVEDRKVLQREGCAPLRIPAGSMHFHMVVEGPVTGLIWYGR